MRAAICNGALDRMWSVRLIRGKMLVKMDFYCCLFDDFNAISWAWCFFQELFEWLIDALMKLESMRMRCETNNRKWSPEMTSSFGGVVDDYVYVKFNQISMEHCVQSYFLLILYIDFSMVSMTLFSACGFLHHKKGKYSPVLCLWFVMLAQCEYINKMRFHCEWKLFIYVNMIFFPAHRWAPTKKKQMICL